MMSGKPSPKKMKGYLLLEWVIAVSCLAGFALLTLSMLNLWESSTTVQQLEQQQALRLLHEKQQALASDQQRWLLQMQQGPL
ncbi:hypothetical protein [Pseudidiomarina terrestris]|uniref:hypothetical protein n=1 Tax=Pseudidiomarina terrestris TaxID=2820060 RepID=UPI00264BF747|nr:MULTISPECIES: hypothetical protein [unclassified Pseudidiomarina]MDN7134741.1 hypothetical protein [Pseudidiomarina sp. 1ASP75-5]MEA3587471.1 hypothetical protein [Pseudidiomarina sp. 1APP75-27a]